MHFYKERRRVFAIQLTSKMIFVQFDLCLTLPKLPYEKRKNLQARRRLQKKDKIIVVAIP